LKSPLQPSCHDIRVVLEDVLLHIREWLVVAWQANWRCCHLSKWVVAALRILETLAVCLLHQKRRWGTF
jgi:hypothetical protein